MFYRKCFDKSPGKLRGETGPDGPEISPEVPSTRKFSGRGTRDRTELTPTPEPRRNTRPVREGRFLPAPRETPYGNNALGRKFNDRKI